jgi:hypothetical protein
LRGRIFRYLVGERGTVVELGMAELDDFWEEVVVARAL